MTAAVHRPAVTDPMAVVADATRRLAAAGVPSPRHDAEELVAIAAGVDRSRLPALTTLSTDVLTEAARLLAARAARVPLQHLTGRAGFRRLELAVGPGVFVPRPETELLAGWAVDRLAGCSGEPLVVDLCAGSGAVGLAVANEVPAARVYLVECDPAAFGWLQRNAAARAAAGDRPVTCVLDRADRALPRLAGQAALVVANPPYIPDGDRDRLEPEVVDHDPPAALWGGPDGLAVVGQVLAGAGRLVGPGGAVGVEHADGQGAAVVQRMRAAGWDGVEDHVDLAGRDRFTTAVRP